MAPRGRRLNHCSSNKSKLEKSIPIYSQSFFFGTGDFFFFLISKGRYIIKKNSAPYIGNVLRRQKHQETKLQRSNKAGRDKQEKAGKTKHHSRRVRKKKDLNSRMDRSRPSKLLAFRSLQIHHIKQ